MGDVSSEGSGDHDVAELPSSGVEPVLRSHEGAHGATKGVRRRTDEGLLVGDRLAQARTDVRRPQVLAAAGGEQGM